MTSASRGGSFAMPINRLLGLRLCHRHVQLPGLQLTLLGINRDQVRYRIEKFGLAKS
jgi:hypothetical protein